MGQLRTDPILAALATARSRTGVYQQDHRRFGCGPLVLPLRRSPRVSVHPCGNVRCTLTTAHSYQRSEESQSSRWRVVIPSAARDLLSLIVACHEVSTVDPSSPLAPRDDTARAPLP